MRRVFVVDGIRWDLEEDRVGPGGPLGYFEGELTSLSATGSFAQKLSVRTLCSIEQTEG